MLNLTGASGDTITVGTTGRRKEAAGRVRAKKADYALAVKGNQPIRRQEIRGYFECLDGEKAKGLPEGVWESGVGKGRGRT
ncbi:MAG: hypothetical protein LBG27_03705, partial [Spirochaetaceae bacterium]|nr:hypothetical protein [Spirochaetaceae bacterium]